ncbi:MAG: class I SAM-dependent methyltransferase [Vulcanimicrobiota bacterium]
MRQSTQNESFQQLFHCQSVLEFAGKAITKSYVECAPGYEREMNEILERTFAVLTASCRDHQDFQNALALVNIDIFQKSNADFWFNRIYSHYKRELKPADRFLKLKEWLSGKTVLDVGCGNGLTSYILNQNGYEVCLTDVLDYRDVNAVTLPFQPMVNPHVIPFPGRHFDTGLVFAVLHHVELSDLPVLLEGLHRMCSRIIVEEDCFEVPDEMVRTSLQDSMMQEFSALSKEDQLRSLKFIDYFANAIAQGIPQMDMPFNFKSVDEWQQLFLAHGFNIAYTVLKGFQAGYFNRTCHVWFILDAV